MTARSKTRMRAISLAIILLLAVQFVSARPDDDDHDHDGDDDHDHDDDDDHDEPEKRLCPSGFTYAADDSPFRMSRDISLDEVERTPVYSCYKIIRNQGTNWVSANLKCIEDESQLASFEDNYEINHFRKKFMDQENPVEEILTSAIHFGADPENGWMWIGSNSSIESNLLTEVFEDNLHNTSKQCLVLHMEYDNSNATYLKPVDCVHSQTSFVCEVRVQTVTYYAWFVANWFTFLLIFLLIILVLSLCISMTMYSKKSGRRERVYRGQSRQDLPPSYHETTRAIGSQESKLDQYRNKGKDLLAKVYLYKDDRKAAATRH